MKLNWGTFIAIGYSVFVLFVIFMVYSAFGEDYDLVTEDYYAQEIAYQDRIDRTSRANRLENSLQVTLEGNNLKVIFPQNNKTLSGSIQCFRPSDESKDFTETFNTSSGSFGIPLNRFIKGKYLIKVDWTSVEEAGGFYQEQVIVIP